VDGNLGTRHAQYALALMLRSPVTFALFGLIITAVVGCGGNGSGPRLSSSENGELSGLKVYRHSMGQAPTSIDPAQSANVYANYVVLNAYDTLFTYKYLARPYVLKPNLAAALPGISPDKLTYTIRIKEGVRFIDDPAFPGGVGREVVAEDFIYSIKRHFDPSNRPQGAWLWQGRIEGLDEWKAAGSDYAKEIPGFRALDRYTIRIQLTRPYPQLLDTFAQGYSGVVPHEAVARYGKELAINPVGSGPFKVVSYDSARIVFERNPNFREEPVNLREEGYDPVEHARFGLELIDGRPPPFLDRLEIHFIKESSARWSSFTKGNEIQFSGLPNEQVDLVLASKDPVTLRPEYADRFFMNTGLETGFVYSAFNMDFPEFGYHPDPEQERRNKALRCAVIKSVDWDARNESFYMGLAKIFPGIIVPVVPEFDPELPHDSIMRDVEGAKRLLATNGWTPDNLPILTYGTTAGITSRLFYEQFRAWLMEIGFPQKKVVLRQFATFGDISKAWKESKLPLISSGWGLDYPDAENTLQLFYGPNGAPGSNASNYANPEYDRLYEQSSVMLPSPERTALYRRMNRILIDDCAVMTGLSRVQVLLWHKDVVALPDRGILGGFFLRYVDVAGKRVSDTNLE
jgi:oligopeptide transport system substrate-binding protein